MAKCRSCFFSLGPFLARRLSMALAVLLNAAFSDGHIFAFPCNGLNRKTHFVCHADCPVRAQVHTDGTSLVFNTLPLGQGFALGEY